MSGLGTKFNYVGVEMGYQHREPGNRTLIFMLLAALIVGAIVILVVVPQVSKDHMREVEIEQAAETERTEERSQFWQKLIPWGEDEDEAAQ